MVDKEVECEHRIVNGNNVCIFCGEDVGKAIFPSGLSLHLFILDMHI